MSLMKLLRVIQNVRGGGKSDAVMGEIHELIVAGRGPEVLLVFPTQSQAYHWCRVWQDVFPFVPVPEFVTINNMLRVRGRQYSRIFIEDIHEYELGIYEPKLDYLWPCLRSRFNDEEVVFTSSPTELNARSHNATMTRADVWARYKRRKVHEAFIP